MHSCIYLYSFILSFIHLFILHISYRKKRKTKTNIEAVVEAFDQALGLAGAEDLIFLGNGPPAGGIAEALGVAEGDEHVLVIDSAEESEDDAGQPPTPPGELPSEDEVEAAAGPTTLLDRLGLICKCLPSVRSDSTCRRILKVIGIHMSNCTCSVSKRKREHP